MTIPIKTNEGLPLIEDISWEDLNQYEFVAYPNHLTVITNATPEAFREAVEVFSKAGNAGHGRGYGSIEDALHSLGYAAVACQKPQTVTTFEL